MPFTDIHAAMENYAEARAAFAEGLRLSPTNAALLTCQARMFRAAGDLDAAARGFDEALAAEPTCIYAFFCRGQLRAQRGEHEQAIPDFSAVIAAEPSCYLRRLQVSAHLARARSLRALGRASFRLDRFHALRLLLRLVLVDRKIRAAEACALPPLPRPAEAEN